MEWRYKKINITVNGEGFFVFVINGEKFEEITLKNAKSTIDKALGDYYHFTQKDMDKLLNKLDEREKELVHSLCQEISNHCGNAYCGLGIVDEVWDWDFI